MNIPRAAAKVVAKVKVSPTGRLSLPIEIRKAVGLEKGGTVVVELHNGTIQLRTMDEAIARAQALARQMVGGNFSVDEFLKFRREIWRE
jgi:AbrB family looped-hinge helix DNA binding protein